MKRLVLIALLALMIMFAGCTQPADTEPAGDVNATPQENASEVDTPSGSEEVELEQEEEEPEEEEWCTPTQVDTSYPYISTTLDVFGAANYEKSGAGINTVYDGDALLAYMGLNYPQTSYPHREIKDLKYQMRLVGSETIYSNEYTERDFTTTAQGGNAYRIWDNAEVPGPGVISLEGKLDYMLGNEHHVFCPTKGLTALTETGPTQLKITGIDFFIQAGDIVHYYSPITLNYTTTIKNMHPQFEAYIVSADTLKQYKTVTVEEQECTEHLYDGTCLLEIWIEPNDNLAEDLCKSGNQGYVVVSDHEGMVYYNVYWKLNQDIELSKMCPKIYNVV